MATVRASFLLGGERFHGRLNRRSVLSDVPAKATRANRAGPGYKVIRLRRLSHWPSVCRPQIEALQSSLAALISSPPARSSTRRQGGKAARQQGSKAARQC